MPVTDLLTLAPRDGATETRPPSRAALAGDGAWRVRSGRVDVFVRPDGPGAGRRHHMFRIEAGGVVFGLPSGGAPSFEAIGDAATALEPLPHVVLSDALSDAGRRATLLHVAQRWVKGLCASLALEPPPPGSTACASGQEIEGEAGTCVRFLVGLARVEVTAGEVELCGHEDLTIGSGGVLAVTDSAWLRYRSAAAVRVTSWPKKIDAGDDPGDLLPALDSLHRLVVAGAPRVVQAITGAEAARQSTKLASARTGAAVAFGDLAAVFHSLPGQRRAAALHAVEPTPHGRLNAACCLVAEHLGVSFAAPTATTYRTIREGVENVARASRFRARQVVLGDAWWRHEQGPLLGFLKEGTIPVALLPRRRSGYQLLQIGHPPRLVDDALAATLTPGAFTFYRPFGPAPVRLLDLVKFGAVGLQRELRILLVTGALIGLAGMAIPVGTGVLVNSIIPSADRVQLGQWVAMLMVCMLANVLFQLTRSAALIRLEMKLGCALQAALWDRIVSLPAVFFRQYSAGNLASRAAGIDALRQTLFGATIRAVLGGVFSVFSFALLFYYDTRLALAGTAILGVSITTFGTIAYFQRQQQREVVSLQAKTSGVVLQFLTGVRKLRVAGAEPRAFAQWARLFSQQRRAQYRIARLSSLWKVFNVAFPLASYALLFAVIVSNAETESIPTGDFLAFLAAFTGCIGATMTTAGAVIGALNVVPQYEMARPILEAAPEVSLGQADPGVLTGEITADHVVFRYRPDGPPVLNDLSFKIRPGEFVAFVGPSGSGKSTIFRLLLGFEMPESGGLAYDSRDLKDLDIRAVRRQIGVVLQNGKLIPGDIYTNIAGCSSASMDEAWTASRMAGLEDDLKRMPMGMHTMVTDGGTLSGGQRQRLMIARAIATAPRMLLFDEATSALDNETQSLVSRSLEQLQATRIVIAHRLSTIVHADRIFVIDAGRIVQTGTYAELLEQPGAFREMAARQIA
jgi:NHLM bacteriocin system ABC transporter ATP-binding protein